MEPKQIEDMLKSALNTDEIIAQGEGCNFGVIVVSDEIAALSKVKQQQTIYAPLTAKGLFANGTIHALTIKVFSQEQWKRERLLNVAG